MKWLSFIESLREIKETVLLNFIIITLRPIILYDKVSGCRYVCSLRSC